MLKIEQPITMVSFLFDDFETLDLMGPVEFLAALPNVEMKYVSLAGGLISSRQGFQIMTDNFESLPPNSLLLLPGGRGVRKMVDDKIFLSSLEKAVLQAELVLSICTGAALLAQIGQLKGRKATSNKLALPWVASHDREVLWQDQARWVVDGKFYTSSGVSAGMDMSLGFVADFWGQDLAEELAKKAEYVWQNKADQDPFSDKSRAI